MKPIYLEFCGLNSFSSKAEIDFSVLLTGGIFGIFGATGSGKSSILDAIHLALYGKVDRAATFNDCINQDSDSVSVTFDFEVVISGKRGQYRVKRETKRKSGSAKAYLYEKQGKEWFALAEGVSDVNKKVEEIVGLSFDDFKTCIALPQGEFAALVKSKLSERVKLMARLFNLEKYGERLFKSVNGRYAEAQREVDRVRTLMVDNEGADEEKIALAQADVQNAEQETAEAKTQTAKIQQKYQELQAVQKEKRAYDQAVAQFTTMQARYDEMQQLQTLIGKYPTARAVADAYALQNRAKQTTEHAKQNLLRADAGYEQAKTEREKAQRLAQENDVEERLLQARMDLQKVRDGADKIHAEQECLKQLNACKKEYAECRFNGVEEDYDTVRQMLEKEYDALGEDEDLLTFLKKNLKGVMLADAYKDVRADLRGIGEKYPQTQADIDQLIEKYYIQNQADLSETDVAAAQLRFKQAEQKRKQIKMQLDALEKRQQEFKAWQDKRKEIEERGKLLKQAHTFALEQIESIRAIGDESTLVKKVDSLQAEKNNLQRVLEKAQAVETDWIAKRKQWEGALGEYQEREKESEAALKTALQDSGLGSVEEAQSVLSRIGDERSARERVSTFFERYAVCKSQVENVDVKRFEGFDEADVETARLEKMAADKTVDECAIRLGARQSTLARLCAAREKYEAQKKELEEKQKQLNVCEELRSLVHGNKFLEYVASEYLQEICAAASKTLLSLTNRKYFLKYDEKEFKVGDNLHGGALRTARTLSGGETFLVSLSLALSLSGAICEQSARPSEFFFLDEGFGTLDEDLVETVMDVLGKLSQSFSIGLISHVEELKRRIERKAIVTPATETSGSSVRLECFG